MATTTIYCRHCHQRLFDITPKTAGSIEIKCSRCRKIIRITFPGASQQRNKDYLAKE